MFRTNFGGFPPRSSLSAPTSPCRDEPIQTFLHISTPRTIRFASQLPRHPLPITEFIVTNVCCHLHHLRTTSYRLLWHATRPCEMRISPCLFCWALVGGIRLSHTKVTPSITRLSCIAATVLYIFSCTSTPPMPKKLPLSFVSRTY